VEQKDEHVKWSSGEDEHVKWSSGEDEHVNWSSREDEHVKWSSGEDEHVKWKVRHERTQLLAVGRSCWNVSYRQTHKRWLCELAVSREHCNDPLGSIKGEEFLDQFEWLLY